MTSLTLYEIPEEEVPNWTLHEAAEYCSTREYCENCMLMDLCEGLWLEAKEPYRWLDPLEEMA